MKKMMFLMLTLILLSAAGMNAQVRIGGTNDPDKTALLDVNPNTGDANGGLALPRVALTSNTQLLNGATPQPGTVVYNTSDALDNQPGAYIWFIGQWWRLQNFMNWNGNVEDDGFVASAPENATMSLRRVRTVDLDFTIRPFAYRGHWLNEAEDGAICTCPDRRVYMAVGAHLLTFYNVTSESVHVSGQAVCYKIVAL